MLSAPATAQCSPYLNFIFISRRCYYVSLEVNGRVIREQWIGRYLEGSGRAVNEVLSQYLTGVTEESHEKLHWGQSVPRPRFEPSTSRCCCCSVGRLRRHRVCRPVRTSSGSKPMRNKRYRLLPMSCVHALCRHAKQGIENAELGRKWWHFSCFLDGKRCRGRCKVSHCLDSFWRGAWELLPTRKICKHEIHRCRCAVLCYHSNESSNVMDINYFADHERASYFSVSCLFCEIFLCGCVKNYMFC
jgi:hypothetical protein